MMKILLQEAFLLFSGAVLMALSWTGCDLYASHRPLWAELPERPPCWADLPLEGTLQAPWGMISPLPCLPGERVSLSWPKGTTGILLYYPRTTEFSLKPAGALVFAGDSSLPVKLSWTEGWLAEALLSVLEDPEHIPPLNWARIRELFRREVGDISPWVLDLEQFRVSWEKGSWGSGTFRPEYREGTWEAPPGIWIPDDPFQRIIPGPGKVSVRLRQGTNLWFFQDRILAVRSLPGGGQDWGVFSTLREPSEPAM